ncbi:tpr domain-containing protein [Ophiostoma piceae UAMH 11346]|uniref:Tpr domain-containing protein n=1 Tax=Ophiostoma piceae (strain UAMH 11346) TaxID=1262450 RepID=S3C6T9_OPHP1|nr:tpr domain-containing protein [Ophiostoma piceae UAMH 11346]
MAKTRPASSKKGKKNKSSSRSGASASPSAGRPSKSPRAYVDEAEIAMTQGDVEIALTAALKAQKTLEDARSGASNNIVIDGVGLAAVYSLVGEIHLENGDVEEARESLTRSVGLDTDGTLPDTLGGGVDKYLYLAQLSEEGGHDSLKWFQQGVEGLRARAGQLHKEIENERRRNKSSKTTKPASSMDGDDDDDDDEDVDEATVELTIINGKLAQILCAMAEVWMTDLSFEDDCEQQCEQLTTEATMVEPRSSEAWQTLANVRISQSREDEARTALQRSLDLWEELPADHPAIPAFSVRVSLARMLMTVGWLAKSIDVTTQLLRDDEQSVEVWYLAGYANYLLGQEQKEEAAKDAQKPQEKWKITWTEARRCLGRCLRRFQQQQYEDERLGEHANELMQELVATVGEPSQKELDEEDYEEEDEWEDDEDEEEGEGDEDNEGDEDEEMED